MTQARDLGNVGDSLVGVSNVSIDSGTLFVDATNNRVAINTTSTAKARFFIEAGSFALPAISYGVNSANVYAVDAFGGAFGFNFSNGGGEVDIWNCWTGANATQGGFIFRRLTGTSTSTTLMSIDGAGRVSKPFTPAFTGGAATKTAGTGGTINGYTSIYNNGGHFNTSTGKFTAPVTGIYHFFGKVQAGFSGGYVYWDFRKNGSPAMNEFHTNMNGSTQWHDSTGSITINLSANDTMEMYIRDNNGGFSEGSFTGFMIG